MKNPCDIEALPEKKILFSMPMNETAFLFLLSRLSCSERHGRTGAAPAVVAPLAGCLGVRTRLFALAAHPLFGAIKEKK